MIQVQHPDFSNTPSSDRRAPYRYRPLPEAQTPVVSIVTPYYNTGPVFLDTVRSIQRMSLPYWEWLIVDDGTTDLASRIQLEQVAADDPRIRVLRQQNGGPAVARNFAVQHALGEYLLLLDSDDMVEPTFVEKAIWFLATQPAGFAAVNAYNVTFGAKNLLWPHGFDHGSENIRENFCTIQSVVRASAYRAVGGFDARVSYEHADWDFWLTLAGAGLWGYTIPEYLTWYRTQERSLLTEIERDHERAARFREWLQKKHAGLNRRFPRPRTLPPGRVPPVDHFAARPFTYRLEKPAAIRRVLFIVPWLEVGGADRLNLDAVQALTRDGYECTIVTTLRGHTEWLPRFTAVTPDVFCLHAFLNASDHPRFISHLLDSRQIDAILVSNSETGYALLSYLRARHPSVAILDYTHSVETALPDGGYPGKSAQAGLLIDVRMANTQQLRDWLQARGVPRERIDVRRCAVNTRTWRPSPEASVAARAQFEISEATLCVAFVGRMSAEKRPLLFAKILAEVAKRGVDVAGLVVGDGPELPHLRRALRRYRLADRIRSLGSLPPERVREALQAADVILLPSALEGLSIALIEAMALGVVPVAARVGGQHELVTPESGFLIAHGPDEVTEYAMAIERLAQDEALREEMARAARACVEQGFDLDTLAYGLRESVERALVVAAKRSNSADPRAAELAHMAVAQLAASDALDARWIASNHHPLHRRLRQARQFALPMGSARYNLYKALRERVRAYTADSTSATAG